MLGGLDVLAQGSTMTDQQVLDYVVTALKAGKDQRTIALELARRGVTEEQAYRVKKLYEESSEAGTLGSNEATATKQTSRRRVSYSDESTYMGRDFDFEGNANSRSRTSTRRSGTGTTSTRTSTTRSTRAQNRVGSRTSTTGKTSSTTGSTGTTTYDGGYVNTGRNTGNRLTTTEELDSRTGDQLAETFWGEEEMMLPIEEEEEELPVFGRNIFDSEELTFEPSMNLATPRNYVLGAGDEVIIDIWGDNAATIREEISPDGTINIESLGLVNLSGKTISEAKRYLRRQLSRIYAGLDQADGVNDMELSLGQSRTIQVHVMGEVKYPGSYSLSAFATVFHALYSAGGVSDIGSLRKIMLNRGGHNVAVLDVYDFIMNGRSKGDVTLEEGDVIVVPAYEQLVELTGTVKRPMRYEMKNGETVKELFAYAGGLSNKAYTRSIRIQRQNGNENEICTVRKDQFGTFPTMDGDAIEIEPILERYSNRIEIKGAVYRPGPYQLGAINTVKQLIIAADGLTGDAFTNRAVLQRENEDLTRSVLSVDVKDIMNGTVSDIVLQKNDILYIPSHYDLNDMGTVTIHGEVARPGDYLYAKNMTIEDLIIQAGGLLESASTQRVDVSRRLKDPKSEAESARVSETFRFAIKDGFIIDGDPTFTLSPYDEVYIRQSPVYRKQTNVMITGEVLFPGEYALTHKSQRLSEIIEQAGGITSFGFVKGARLTRMMNDEEKERQKSVIKMSQNSKDSISEAMLDISNTYSVGIDLEKAIKNPGSQADVVLREGDIIEVPEYTNTVKISGAVMHPNTVSYVDKKPVKYYIEQAGGFGNRAKKRRAYVVCMNGQVKRARRNSTHAVEPGCELIIPMKEQSNWNVQQTMSVATASASLATMVASIANILK
jgi:protein involved in polysaccharide export with SLBB domain